MPADSKSRPVQWGRLWNAVLRQVWTWFALRTISARELEAIRTKEARRNTERVIGLLTDLVLAFVLGVVQMPVLFKWAVWLFCWCALVYICSTLGDVSRLPAKTRLTGSLILVVVFATALWGTAKSQWVKEKASAFDGDLKAPKCATQNVVIQVGEDGATLQFNFKSRDRMQMAYDSWLSVWVDDNRFHLSTKVRDSQGATVVEIADNHWEVSRDKSVSWDHNYDRDSLEVKDRRDHVVLQVRMMSDRIQLAGEWHDEFGNGSCIKPDMPRSGGLIANLARDELLIKPRFEYPSKQHWSKLVSNSRP